MTNICKVKHLFRVNVWIVVALGGAVAAFMLIFSNKTSSNDAFY